MIERFDVVPYRLGLRRPWSSARGHFRERCGWLVRVGSDGRIGFGDCAPLTEAGTEAPERAYGTLSRWRQELVEQPLDVALTRCDEDRTSAPAAHFAVECALLDLLSQQQGQSLRQLLTAVPADQVPVNAMLGPLGPDTLASAQATWRNGFQVLKIKVGIGEPTAERQHLLALAGRLPPGVVLRLDANGAWGMNDAVRIIEALANAPIEAIEEPLREPQRLDLLELQALAPFPLALDESLHRPPLADSLSGGLAGDPAELPTHRLVLKPAVVGGLRATLAYARRATAAGRQVVITSLVESAAGIWPSLQLAAALPCQPAHGLATSTWLTEDLGVAPVAHAGLIALPDRHGSGFTPNGVPAGRSLDGGEAGRAG